MTAQPLVYAIVLAWNHAEETLACLESLLRSDYEAVRFAVVDNGSTDGTPGLIRERFPQVELVLSPTNLGVAGGYNLGMRYALEHGATHILIANNDIEFDPAMLRCLVEALEKTPGAGMAMPKIYHYYGDRTRLWCTGARWRSFPPTVKMMGVDAKDSPAFQQLRQIEYAPSCCLLLRSEAVAKTGLFDTGYFFYNDDWDYSVRLRQAGYSIWFVPAAKMWHKVSISTQKSEKPAQWWQIMGRSTVRFFRQHSTSRALLAYSVWFVIRECVKGKFGRVRPFLAGVREQRALERTAS